MDEHCDDSGAVLPNNHPLSFRGHLEELLLRRFEKNLAVPAEQVVFPSHRNIKTLKDQIAADEQANLVMQDEAFEALEKIDELAGRLSASNDSLTTVQVETTKISNRVESEQLHHRFRHP